MKKLMSKVICDGAIPKFSVDNDELNHEIDLVEATFKLGTLYASGHADPNKKPNMKKAFELYQQAADKGGVPKCASEME